MDKGPPPPGFHHPHAPPPFDQQPPPAPPPVTVVRAPIYGPTPTTAQCPNCNQMVQSHIIKKSSGKTHLIALAMCLFQCWICIPCLYCSDSLRESHHHCPSCNAFLGAYSSL